MNNIFGTKNIKAAWFVGIGLTFAALFANFSYADTATDSMNNIEESAYYACVVRMAQNDLNRGLSVQSILDGISNFWYSIIGKEDSDSDSDSDCQTQTPTLTPTPTTPTTPTTLTQTPTQTPTSIPTCNNQITLYLQDDIWSEVVKERNIDAMWSFYNDQSILAKFPYDKSKNLVGVDNIAAMFANDLFSLTGDLKLETNSLAKVIHNDIALIIKQWKMNNSANAFHGMAIELLTYDQQWSRLIDLEADGLTQPADFAKTKSMTDNSAFGHLADRLLTSMENAKRFNLNSPQEEIVYGDSKATITTIVAIPNQDYGLLIARVANDQGQYLTFNAVKHTLEGWQVIIQARMTLCINPVINLTNPVI